MLFGGQFRRPNPVLERTLVGAFLRTWWFTVNQEQAISLLCRGPEGVQQWNAIRRELPELPSFEGAALQGLDLNGANLDDLNLSGAKLCGAVLDNGSLENAVLIGADLRTAKLNQVNLHAASLEDANLAGAILTGSNLRKTILTRADLSGCDLAGAILFGAVLSGANFSKTNLNAVASSRARLLPFHQWPLLLDDTGIESTRFSRNMSDPWSILRRKYTGHLLAFHLIFLTLFFLPYLARTAFWIGANHMETLLIDHTMLSLQRFVDSRSDQSNAEVSGLRADISTLSQQWATSTLIDRSRLVHANPHFRSQLRDVVNRVLLLHDLLMSDRLRFTTLETILNREVEERRVVELVLGLSDGVGQLLLTMALVVYNIFRAILTYLVGSLREEEARTGRSPRCSEYLSLFRIHQAVSLLFFVALASLVVNAVSWLGRPVFMLR